MACATPDGWSPPRRWYTHSPWKVKVWPFFSFTRTRNYEAGGQALLGSEPPATSSSRSLSGLVFDQWELSRFHCLHGLKNLQIFFWFKYDDNWFSMISSEFQWWELIFRVNFWCLDSGSAPVMRSTKRTLPVRSRFQCLKEWNAWASCRGIIFIWRIWLIWYSPFPFSLSHVSIG